MARLTWGDPGSRFFEAGVDRGVLYVTGKAGVSWNGLTSVKESPSGGDPTPYYIDGVKYLNIATSEEFEASIDAFSAPKEFGVCDGTAAIHHGLFATQQPRKSFGLTYRTILGNDQYGVDHGYKIHLVYNALASPSDRENKTLSDQQEPIIFSWSLTTVPLLTPFAKPTAHFVVDSITTPPTVLEILEDYIYGSEGHDPLLPTVDDLIAIFAIPSPDDDDIFTELFEGSF